MGFSSPNRLLLRTLMMLCAVGFCFSDAQPVCAGCGDYVMVNGSHMPSHHVQSTSLYNPAVPHCTGPECRQRQKSPLSPGESVSLTQPTDLILLAYDAAPSTSLQAGVTFEGLLGPADAPAGSIFKPPRG